LEEVIGREPTPEFALQIAEECERLLARLGDEGLRTVALWRMEGYTVEEIAVRLECVPRTIERKLRVIRRLWGEKALP
jgi:DNA-directed RNA polymerase specialized sigma24 family protein